MPMKFSSDIIGNQNRNIPSCDAAPQISATARLIVHDGNNFIYFVQLNIHYRVYSVLPLASLFLSMSAAHNLKSYNFNIHINVIAASAIIFSTWCLRFIYSSQNFVCLFLICHQCHISVPTRPDTTNSVFRTPRH
jgi:hypothetical protein